MRSLREKRKDGICGRFDVGLAFMYVAWEYRDEQYFFLWPSPFQSSIWAEIDSMVPLVVHIIWWKKGFASALFAEGVLPVGDQQSCLVRCTLGWLWWCLGSNLSRVKLALDIIWMIMYYLERPTRLDSRAPSLDGVNPNCHLVPSGRMFVACQQGIAFCWLSYKTVGYIYCSIKTLIELLHSSY